MFQDSKNYTTGSHRVVDPVVTRQKIENLFPIFGISRVSNVTGLDTIGIPVYMAIRPNSASLSVSQGKGINDNAAFVSAAMEAIELYHAENISSPIICGSYAELSINYNIVNPNTLTRLDESTINIYKKTMWVDSVNLIDKRKILLPFEKLNLNTTFDFPKHICLLSSSNGLASGNTKKEAIVHGICEVIERDSIALWQLSDPVLTKLNLDTIDDADCLVLLKKIKNSGIKIGVWDCTSNLGVPTFLCKIISNNEAPVENILPAVGSGTHLDKGIALSRAITEAVQSRLTFITGSRDDLKGSTYKEFINKETYDFWEKQIDIKPSVDYRSIDTRYFRSLNQDLKYLLDVLKKNGFNEVIVTDISKKEFKIPVVKITIPNLEEFSETNQIVIGNRGMKYLNLKKKGIKNEH